MREITRIFIHCSFTKPRTGRAGSPLIGAAEIRKWHVEERGWRDIGYHYVVKRNGVLELGRPLDQAGAHVAGYNKDSIGICLVGGMNKTTGKAVNDYTDEQWQTLRMIVGGLMIQFPKAEVLGHNDVTTTKTCPNFDVREWWDEISAPFKQYFRG